MKTYDKQKLNEYAKELFALCLEKELIIEHNPIVNSITVYMCFKEGLEYVGYCYLNKETFKLKNDHLMPIWELIEKVKAL